MDDQELIDLWQREAQRPFEGWDFSYLAGRYTEADPPWSYDSLVRLLLKNADSVLDMGTGGGEKLLEFRDALPEHTVATEGYAPNVPVARANLAPVGIEVVEYDRDTSTRMPFEDATFSLVINRHESYHAEEVKRVLRSNGVFLTQQVDGHDLDDLLSILELDLEYLHVTLENCRRDLEEAGLHIEQAEEWAGKTMFADVATLVFFLRAIMPETFTVHQHTKQLLRLHQQPKPLQFTIRRFLLQARKTG